MTNSTYQYGGAAACVTLLKEHLQEFLETWRQADALEIELPEDTDLDCSSREHLLLHVLRCASRHLIWICDQLEIPAPDVERDPQRDGISERAEEDMEKTLAAWDLSMRALTEEAAYSESYPSEWGPLYCIDAMLEHAVMHPIRHSLQLKKLMAEREAER